MSAKQKKPIDQRAPQIGYERIKSLRSLAMKNYLVTGGLLSLVETYNNLFYLITVLMAYVQINIGIYHTQHDTKCQEQNL